ncbi:MAG: hypothetical protein HYS40_07400 [Gemmatimonadetes bacterium]|nr:hypothetical protein [Gemmatimonadota bacterium]
MRRSIPSMLMALGWLSTPLAAQTESSGTSWGLGFAATLGSGWQIEGGEIGVQRHVGTGPVRFVTAAVRLGSFIDQGAIIGGGRGFVAALAVGARTGAVTLFEVGSEEEPTRVALDLTVEAAGYLGANSPLPQGGRWAAVAVLPGLRFGNPGSVQYHVLLGPTAFLGGKTDLRSFLGIRFEAPLARRERRP